MGKMRTKAGRMEARALILEGLRKNGATITEHPEADCVSVYQEDERGAIIRLYSGTAYRPELYELHRNPDRAKERLAERIEAHAARQQRKKDEHGKRQLTGAAQTAAAIRRRLGEIFPGVKFSVTSENYSMGNAVSIHWTDGPISSLVEFYTDQYAYGTYDGFTDCSGVCDIDPALGVPGAKHVHCSRTISQEHREMLEAHARSIYGDNLPADRFGEFSHMRYENEHPELWPHGCKALWESQQEQRREKAQQAEERRREQLQQEEERRQEQKRKLHRLARITALRCLEIDSRSIAELEAMEENALRDIHGAVLLDEAARLANEYLVFLTKINPMPHHFSQVERAAFLAMDAEHMPDMVTISPETFADIVDRYNLKPASATIVDFTAYRAAKSAE